MTNLNTAFDVAEKYLDIPKMLDAEGEQAGRKTGGGTMKRSNNVLLFSKTKTFSHGSLEVT